LKTEESLEAKISATTLELTVRFLSSDQTNFGEQVKLLGLDPNANFRHADLSYIDFSDSDLRGFDFTGADLRGAIGVNVKWDKTTKLFDSDVTDSLFAYAAQRERFFSSNTEQAERVERLATDYWANTIIQIATMLETEKDRKISLQIAKAVFEDTKNPTVRTSILLHMGAVSDSREDQKAFIYNLLAKFGDDKSALRPALSALRFLYRNDLDAFNMMLKFLSYPDDEVQSNAMAGVLSSSHFFASFSEIRDRVLISRNPVMRRALVGRIARRELRESALLLEDNVVINFVDFREAISAEKLKAMARRSYNRITSSEVERLAYRLGFDPSVAYTDPDADRANLIRHSLLAIRDKYRVPFDIYTGDIR
jgi:hypothetical protein